MTRGQGDYSKSKVYKILFVETGEFYVGSTRTTLRQRMHHHRDQGKRNPHRPLYALAQERGWDSTRIILLEECPCDNKDQLVRKEQEYIDSLRCELCLNIIDAKCDPAKKRRRATERARGYVARNVDKLREYKAGWYLSNYERLRTVTECGCGGRYSMQTRRRHERSKMHQAYISGVS